MTINSITFFDPVSCAHRFTFLRKEERFSQLHGSISIFFFCRGECRDQLYLAEALDVGSSLAS